MRSAPTPGPVQTSPPADGPGSTGWSGPPSRRSEAWSRRSEAPSCRSGSPSRRSGPPSVGTGHRAIGVDHRAVGVGHRAVGPPHGAVGVRARMCLTSTTCANPPKMRPQPPSGGAGGGQKETPHRKWAGEGRRADFPSLSQNSFSDHQKCPPHSSKRATTQLRKEILRELGFLELLRQSRTLHPESRLGEDLGPK